MNEDLSPYLLCRRDGESAECATWRLELGGHPALALFTSLEAADSYRSSSGLDAQWEAIQPARRAQAEVLRASFEGQSLQYAVLDPTEASARRVFELRPMMEQILAETQSE